MNQEIPTLTVILHYSSSPQFQAAVNRFIDSSLIEKIFILHTGGYDGAHRKCESMRTDSCTSGKTLNRVIAKIKSKYFITS